MKIVFWNCGGTGNLGDDLCHLGAVQWCRNRFGNFQHERIFKLNDYTLDRVNKADLLVIGGGQLLDYTDFLKRLFNHKVTIPYMFLGVGIGCDMDVVPYIDLLKPIDWIVRDTVSQVILNRCGFEAKVAADLSFLLPIQFKASKNRIGLSFKNCNKAEIWVSNIASALDHLKLPVTLVAMNSVDPQTIQIDGESANISDGNDSFLMEAIANRMVHKELVETISYDVNVDDPIQFAEKFGEFSFFIGERLHSVLLAHMAKVPFRAITYHCKVYSFLQDHGLESCAIDGSFNSVYQSLINGVAVC